MSARLVQYRLLWQAAHAQAHPRAQAILWSVTVILTVAVTALMGAVYGAQVAAGWALATPAGVLLFTWTMAFIPSALGLNHPANAQLVPGMRRRLIELALLVWFAAIGLLAAGMLLIPDASPLVLPFAMAGTLGVATLMAGVGAGVVLMLPFFFSFLSAGWQAWLRDAAAQPGVMSLVATGMAVLAVPVVWTLFPRGGERHWAMLEHRALMMDGSGKGVFLAGLKPYVPQRLRQRRLSAQGTPGALLLRALGPDLFALTAWGSLGAALAFTGITWHLRGTSAAGDPAPIWLLSGSFILCVPLMAASVPALLPLTRGEQALVRLAPVSPNDPARFNALLARTMLRQGLAIWAWISVVTLLLALAGGIRGMVLVGQACVCCMTLPTLAIVLRDHACMPRWSALFYGLAAVGLGCIGPIVGVIGFKWLGLPGWPVATVTALVLAVVLVRGRWRRMCAAPIAFPAGRLD
ncbi:hypothetical protein AB2N08_10405 [Massilia aurea]|uniref:hypothetical protein n=1 Tax=Massilia aurea TaxID=373040 RepID=UPI003462779B